MFKLANKIRQKDLEELIQNPIFKEFKNCTVMVTGATGLIGSEIVFAFLLYGGIKVVALVRNLEKAKQVFKDVLNNPNLEIIVQDINTPLEYSDNVQYIVHTANTTASAEMVKNPVKTMLTIIDGTKNVLEFAREKKVKSLCYISSLEVYGDVVSEEKISEDYLGSLDLTNPRSSYPEGKRAAECLCASYAAEYGVRVKIARLTQTFGAGISKEDNRVFAQFAKSIIEKKDIILHTEGKTVRNYCYLTDAVSGILTILIKGTDGEVYNIANENTAISIRNMAELAAKNFDSRITFNLDNENRGYNNYIKLCLDTLKLRKLGWKPYIDLQEMYRRTILFMEAEHNV